MRLEQILPPGSLQAPVEIVSRASDDALYIVQLNGRVRVLRHGVLDPVPYVDIAPRVEVTWQTGLRALAFHPAYASNGYAYLWYDAVGQGHPYDLVLARVTRSSSDPLRADPGSLVELMRIQQIEHGHGGGHLEFGPDGMLYGAIGDGGVQDDPACNAQNDGVLLGTMFRIDVDGAFPYAIPNDNPFIGVPGVRPEILHTGLRHPWKWSFDRHAHDIWIADVGQWQREEINVVGPAERGRDFGWSIMEGNLCHGAAGCPPTQPTCFHPAYSPPIFEYPHADGCSIIGGYVYRGNAIPDMYGAYIYADYCQGRVWAIRRSGTQVTWSYELTNAIEPGGGIRLLSPSTFGEDSEGELWVADLWEGELFKLVRRTGLSRYCDALPNSSGNPAALDWTGSVSVSAGDLSFAAHSAPGNTFGVLFYGSGRTAVPQGAGLRCVDGSLFRVVIAAGNSTGDLHFPLNFTTAPLGIGAGRVTAGSTWNFQAWYRDNGPAGANSNLTDALSVLFAP